MAWDITKLIRQLMAKAESTKSLEEADTIMIKVRQLLEKHGVSLLTIKHTAASDDPVDATQEIYGFWRADHWMQQLSAAAGAYYGVEVVWFRKGNYTTITAVGRESSRAAYAAMLPYLRKQVIRNADHLWLTQAYSYGNTKSKARTAIGHALTDRLWSLYWERKNTADPKLTAGLNMLVPVDEIKLATDDLFPELKTVNLKRNLKLRYAALQLAEKIPLEDQVTEEKEPKNLLE